MLFGLRFAACRVTAARATTAFTKILQHMGKQRCNPIRIQPCRVRGSQPAQEGAAKSGQLWQSDLAERGLDERALTGSSGCQTLGLQVPVRLASPRSAPK